MTLRVSARRRTVAACVVGVATVAGCHRQDPQVHYESVPNVPHAALTIDGHTQVAWVGTLCWPVPEGEDSCIDYEWPVTFGDALVVGPARNATLTFSPEARPSKIVVNLIAVTPDMADTTRSPKGATYWRGTASHPQDSWRLIAAEPKLTQELRLDAPPGRYVLDVEALWDIDHERHGDTSQAFLIDVRP